jgi:hypothetical protein
MQFPIIARTRALEALVRWEAGGECRLQSSHTGLKAPVQALPVTDLCGDAALHCLEHYVNAACEVTGSRSSWDG